VFSHRRLRSRAEPAQLPVFSLRRLRSTVVLAQLPVFSHRKQRSRAVFALSPVYSHRSRRNRIALRVTRALTLWPATRVSHPTIAVILRSAKRSAVNDRLAVSRRSNRTPLPTPSRRYRRSQRIPFRLGRRTMTSAQCDDHATPALMLSTADTAMRCRNAAHVVHKHSMRTSFGSLYS